MHIESGRGRCTDLVVALGSGGSITLGLGAARVVAAVLLVVLLLLLGAASEHGEDGGGGDGLLLALGGLDGRVDLGLGAVAHVGRWVCGVCLSGRDAIIFVFTRMAKVLSAMASVDSL